MLIPVDSKRVIMFYALRLTLSKNKVLLSVIVVKAFYNVIAQRSKYNTIPSYNEQEVQPS